MDKKDGMNYAPKGKPNPVVNKGEFVFAVIGLDHGHIYGMSNGLLEAGASLKWVYDPDPAKVETFINTYEKEGVKAAESEEQIYNDPEVKLVAAACVTSERAALGVRVMRAGKGLLCGQGASYHPGTAGNGEGCHPGNREKIYGQLQ